MNKKVLFTLAGAAVLAFSAKSDLSAAELLLNGSFEGPAQTTNGDHTGTVPTSWTISPAGQSNLTRGVVTSGTTAGGLFPVASNLPLDPNDPGSQQSLDINGVGTASQSFIAIGNAPVTVKFDIGGRDNNTTPTGSTWSLLNAGGTVIASSPVTLNPAYNTWTTNTSTTSISLVLGQTYTFRINLDNAQQVDGLSVQQVPEPSALAAAGIGASLLGWMGFQRRRRA